MGRAGGWASGFGGFVFCILFQHQLSPTNQLALALALALMTDDMHMHHTLGS
jgi:hypothetical protein